METESSPQPTEESADQTKPNRPFRIKIGSQREHDNSGSPAESPEQNGQSEIGAESEEKLLREYEAVLGSYTYLTSEK